MHKEEELLKIQNISKRYGDFQALDNVGLNINYKDFYALLGANGAGKTTLIGIITDLVTASSGDIIINGFNLKQQTAQAKQCLGVVPQEINLNVFEKVDQVLYQQAQYYGIKASAVRERVDYLLEKLHLTDKKHSNINQLSGGMKRRLMIARAMIHSPKILLLDEPTAGVDVEVRKSLWSFLKQENANGLTIILTTHYLEEAEALCNRVGMIKNGCKVFEGEMATLLNQLEGEHIVIEIDSTDIKPTSALQEQCISINGSILELQLRRGQQLQEIITQINKSGGNIIRIEHQAGRLEQVFTNILASNT